MTDEQRSALKRLADLHSAYTNNTVGFGGTWFEAPALRELMKLGFAEKWKPFQHKPNCIRYRITSRGREAALC